MDGKKKTIIFIGLFVVLMVGASALYNNLSEDYKMNSLVENDSDFSANVSNDNKNSNNNSANTTTNDSSENTTESSDEKDTTDSSTTDTNKSETSTDNSNSSEESSKNENLAPNFTVYDLDGNDVNLTDFFGKPIIVNFWASWCGPCKMEMPDFDEAYQNYNGEIEFLMVNMTDGSRETLEKASSFITESGYSFPVYYDTEYSAAITYSVSSLPTTYFIDAEGILIAHARGAIDSDTLQKGIDMIYDK